VLYEGEAEQLDIVLLSGLLPVRATLTVLMNSSSLDLTRGNPMRTLSGSLAMSDYK
jgi:hypothetical protein